jgi:hypothetical protein
MMSATMPCFAKKDDSFARKLHTHKAVVRGAMAALRSAREPWERREFELVRKGAVQGIISLMCSIRGVSASARKELLQVPDDLTKAACGRLYSA